MRKLFAAAAAVVLGWTTSSYADLYIAGYNSTVNDRFTAPATPNPSGSFIANGYDLTGVGNSAADGTGTFATMISPTFFLSAEHYHPAPGSTVTFYNATGTAKTYTVETGYTTSYLGLTSDLWLGKLTASVDSDIAKYSVVDNAATDEAMFVYGRPNRVGKNSYDGLDTLNSVTPIRQTRVLVYDYDDPNVTDTDDTAGQGANESYVIAGDSSAPSFMVRNGQLGVVGIHYNHSSDTVANDEESYDSYVPEYISQLNISMALTSSERVTVVPEPTAAVAVGGLASMLSLVRRRAARPEVR
jgi:hypothetical protein